jgi:outer membrane immunogenic protein
MRNTLVSFLVGIVLSLALGGFAVAAPPVPPSWTGFYAGPTVGYAWGPSNRAAYSPNDPLSAALFSGTIGAVGEQPLATRQAVYQNGAVGGFEAGYNWQAGANWLWGFEADFTFADESGGGANSTAILQALPPPNFSYGMSLNARQSTDWYGTVRGRLGWLAQPNLLIFGTGGFAYGRVTDTANLTITSATAPSNSALVGSYGYTCATNVPCYIGSSSAIGYGWAAGAGAELLVSDSVSFKVEYQFVDLGSHTVVSTALPIGLPGILQSSFSTAFHEQIQVVRLGLNWHF